MFRHTNHHINFADSDYEQEMNDYKIIFICIYDNSMMIWENTIKMAKRILNVDENAVLRGYASSAEAMAIASAEVCFDGPDSQIADLMFSDDKGCHREYSCWENEHPEEKSAVEIIDDGNSIVVNTQNVETQGKGQAFLYEKADCLRKSCQVKCVSFKRNHICSFFGLKLASFVNDTSKKEFRAGFFPNNKVGYVHYDFENNISEFNMVNNEHRDQYIKMMMDADELIVFLSADGITWSEFHREKNLIPNEGRLIGFMLWTGDEFFKNWFYTNYIQLHSSHDMSLSYDVKLDYYLGYQSFGRYNSFNPWIKESAIDPLLLEGGDCIDTVKRIIDAGYCIGLMLNERYLKNRWAYNDLDFDHENMVYGYDSDEQKIYICGFNAHQHFTFEAISFEVFRKAYQHLFGSYDWKLMKYEVQYYEYALDKNLVIKQLTEYRDGIDSSYREELKINQKIRIFGTRIYEALRNHIEHVQDVRVPYIIYEHKTIMTKRIQYFRGRRLLNHEDAEVLLIKSKKLERMTYKLLLLGIKYNAKTDAEDTYKIRALIDEICQTDCEFVDELIQKLEYDYELKK